MSDDVKPRRKDQDPKYKFAMIMKKTVRNGDCLEWTGNFFQRKKDKKKTYPYIYFRNKPWRGNRLVLFLSSNKMPVGLYALHRCDNTKCLNPKHLYWGTHTENVRDCVDRGRHKETKKTHCKFGHEYSKENTVLSKRKRGIYRRCRKCLKRYREAKCGKSS